MYIRTLQKRQVIRYKQKNQFDASSTNSSIIFPYFIKKRNTHFINSNIAISNGPKDKKTPAKRGTAMYQSGCFHPLCRYLIFHRLLPMLLVFVPEKPHDMVLFHLVHTENIFFDYYRSIVLFWDRKKHLFHSQKKSRS